MRDGAGQLTGTLHLSNRCYTTSAQSETYVTIDGKRYGHIINPLTGMPSANRQAGLVTDRCMTGDMLSTGLFLQTLTGFEACMQLLRDQVPGIEGFLTDSEGNTSATPGLSALMTAAG